MAAATRTVSLPIRVGISWDSFSWALKRPNDSLDYTLDCTAWMLDSGRFLQSVSVSLTPGLTLVGVANTLTVVTLQISGGVPLTTAQVGFDLTLDNGHALEVLVALPIDLGLPPGLVPSTGAGTLLLFSDGTPGTFSDGTAIVFSS